MLNIIACLLAVLLVSLTNVNSMAIRKRSDKSENNLEKPDQTEYPNPMEVNYDVYPVRIFSILLLKFLVKLKTKIVY